jgi:hypothetical protein
MNKSCSDEHTGAEMLGEEDVFIRPLILGCPLRKEWNATGYSQSVIAAMHEAPLLTNSTQNEN